MPIPPTQPDPSLRIFDAHLDLACLEALGRDMSLEDPRQADRPHTPGAITLPALARSGIRACLATIFTETNGKEQETGYASGDHAASRAAAMRQLEIYRAWHKAGHITLGRDALARAVAAPLEHTRTNQAQTTSPPAVALLIEGADPISGPDDLPMWKDAGAVAIGLTWAHSSKYAAGNAADPRDNPGLTPDGRSLVRAMDELGLVHDASHLSDRALADLLSATNAVVIATHSNCRTLIDTTPMPDAAIPRELKHDPVARARIIQRHLTDDSIREIARRGGVIGINFYSPFLNPGGTRDRRAPLHAIAEHAERIMQLIGHDSGVGLGTDIDGGFGSTMLPEGLDTIDQLPTLAEHLTKRGWTKATIDRFLWQNWADFWLHSLS
ncbi:MAG: dipeptidase [Phycisphaerales bacterium]